MTSNHQTCRTLRSERGGQVTYTRCKSNIILFSSIRPRHYDENGTPCAKAKVKCQPTQTNPKSLISYSSFKCPVTASTRLLGAGPTPKTVTLPASI